MQDKIMQKMVDNVFCVANRITGDKIVNINKFFINHNGVKSEFIIAINMLWIEFRLLFICKYLERGECKITKKMNTKKVFHNKYGMSNVFILFLFWIKYLLVWKYCDKKDMLILYKTWV